MGTRSFSLSHIFLQFSWPLKLGGYKNSSYKHRGSAESQPPYVAVALVAAAMLSFEILLMNLFTVVHWYHFAYMLISIALLGVGASGTFIYVISDRVLGNISIFITINSFLFCFSALVGFVIAQRISFSALEILWDWRPLFDLAFIYFLLMLPFFFGSNCISACLFFYKNNIGRVYSADLIGAALGGTLLCLGLDYLDTVSLLRVILVGGCCSCLMMLVRIRYKHRLPGFVVFMFLLIVILVTPSAWMKPQPNEYKGVSRTLMISGSELVFEKEDRYGLLQVIDNREIPLRSAAGLSHTYNEDIPHQLAVFKDADRLFNLSAYGKELLDFVHYLPSALPSFLVSWQYGEEGLNKIADKGVTNKEMTETVTNALVNNWNSVLQLQRLKQIEPLNRPITITWVHPNPNVVSLVGDSFGEFSGWDQLASQLVIEQNRVRSFLLKTQKKFDLIQFDVAPSLSGAGAGNSALVQHYGLTSEAIALMMERLTESGTLSFTFLDGIPPKTSFKLLLNVLSAAESINTDISQHLLMIRGWQHGVLLYSKKPVNASMKQGLLSFCETLGFDPVYFPGISLDQVNKYSKLVQPYFYTGVQDLIAGNKDQMISQYVYNIESTRDNSPYFFHFFRWDNFRYFFAQKDKGGVPLIEWSYLVVVMTLIQAVIFSLLLIGLPLLFVRRLREEINSQGISSLAFFCFIGFAFMFIEINFIQRMQMLFDVTSTTVAVVLGSLLAFSGLGAYFSSICSKYFEGYTGFNSMLVCLIFVVLIYTFLLPEYLMLFMASSSLAKVFFCVVIMLPVGVLMGMPLPWRLFLLAQENKRLVPLAWAANGCCSVIGAVLAMIMAFHLGLDGILVVATLCYGLAFFSSVASRR